MTTFKEPFEKALAATPEFPANSAVSAYRSIRRRIVFKNIAGFSSVLGMIALVVLVTGTIRFPHSTPQAPSAEVVEELQYVHDCIWGADSEADVQYASAF
jgi:hypothetical protein